MHMHLQLYAYTHQRPQSYVLVYRQPRTRLYAALQLGQLAVVSQAHVAVRGAAHLEDEMARPPAVGRLGVLNFVRRCGVRASASSRDFGGTAAPPACGAPPRANRPRPQEAGVASRGAPKPAALSAGGIHPPRRPSASSIGGRAHPRGGSSQSRLGHCSCSSRQHSVSAVSPSAASGALSATVDHGSGSRAVSGSATTCVPRLSGSTCSASQSVRGQRDSPYSSKASTRRAPSLLQASSSCSTSIGTAPSGRMCGTCVAAAAGGAGAGAGAGEVAGADAGAGADRAGAGAEAGASRAGAGAEAGTGTDRAGAGTRAGTRAGAGGV